MTNGYARWMLACMLGRLSEHLYATHSAFVRDSSVIDRGLLGIPQVLCCFDFFLRAPFSERRSQGHGKACFVTGLMTTRLEKDYLKES